MDTTAADLSHPETWPLDVKSELEKIAEALLGRPNWNPVEQHTPDLRWSDPDTEREFDLSVRQRLDATGLLVYHGSRLLAHEVDSIRSRGLIQLSEELRHQKLTVAAAEYPDAISASEVDWLVRNGPLAWGPGAPFGLARSRSLPPWLRSTSTRA